MSTKKGRKRFTDPMAEREASNYANPVPSREAISACLGETEPMALPELEQALGVTGERDTEAFSRRLRAMERDGQLLRNRRGRYGLVSKMDMVCGTVTGHADGFGFLIPEEGGEDLFLSPKEMRKVLHGDRVMGRVTGIDRRGRREGAVIEVLEHRHSSVVGRYSNDGQVGYVIPEDKRINQDVLIPDGENNNARDGQIVLAELTRQPSYRTQPVGRIVEVLGDHMAAGMEVEVVIRKHELPYKWPDDVLDEAHTFGDKVSDESKQGRKDLTRLPLLTIDGADAKDFDDAVYAERDGKGWKLYIAIADVSHYVKPDSKLNKEAYNRGTSVYFPNRVIPMLPEALSNGLCSLKPKVDRLCMVCEIRITPQGKIRDYRFYEALMCSHARLTYDEVASILVERKVSVRDKYAELIPHLEQLYDLYKVLHKVRLKRGSVDFDLPETKIVFDDNGKIDQVVPVVRNNAHRLIEECMLAANICAAEFLKKKKIPTPYRIHDGPTEEKLLAVREFLFELGLTLGGGDKPTAKDYSVLLTQAESRPDAHLIQTVMLRSLSQAVYSPDNIGHFALAYPAYGHFTSPIRRYPDLMVHRSIKLALSEKTNWLGGKWLTGKGSKDSGVLDYNTVKIQSEHCSVTGRRADEANWDVLKWLKTEFMMDKVGEEFEGVISGVTNFGLFIELKDTYVEGLVHVTELGNDYYHYDPGKHRMVGERTNQTFRLGDQVRVKVMRVDLDEARIDFELLDLLTIHKDEHERKQHKRSGKTGTRRGKAGKRDNKRSSKKSASKRSGKKTAKKSSKKKTGKKKSKKRRKSGRR